MRGAVMVKVNGHRASLSSDGHGIVVINSIGKAQAQA